MIEITETEALNRVAAYCSTAEHCRAEIAEKLETSRSTLEHLFQESLSVSPHRYFARLKLDTAKSLLLQTELSIQQIAENVGALNSMQFCRSFKSECGLSPSEFRRNGK